MKKILNQRGALVFEIVVGILVLVVAGVVGYSVFQNRQVDKPNEAQTQVKKDPYAGWLTGKSDLGGFTYKYPKNWKVSVKNPETNSQDITLESPTGFLIKYNVHKGANGVGGSCDDQDHKAENACPLLETYVAEKLFNTADNDVYLVEQKQTDKDNLTFYAMGLQGSVNGYVPKVGKEYAFTIFIHNGKPAEVAVFAYANYPMESPKNELSKSEFFALADVKAAELILRSFKY